MKSFRSVALRAGLTLMELVVVISILALLAALVVPKLADLVERSRSSTQAYSTADVSRQIETFFGLNKKYPDGWDTLMDSSDGSLYSKLNTGLTSSSSLTDSSGNTTTVGPILTTTTLSSDQVASLNNAGIGHAFLHDSISQASSSGTDRRHFGTGTGHDGTTNISTFAAINEAAGSKGLLMLINDFGLNPNRSASDTTLTRINANTYVVFGLGPKSTLVQTQIQEAPFMENASSSTTYSRALAVFEVPNASSVTGTALSKAKLVGVFGPDGRTKGGAVSDYNNISGVQPH